MISEQVNSIAIGTVLSIQPWPSPTALEEAYELLKADGLLELIWHWRDQPLSFEEMWRHAQEIETIYFCAYYQSPEGQVESAGIGWAYTILPYKDGFRAEVGQCFRRKFWKQGIPKELVTLMLDYCFNDAMIVRADGLTPVKNLVAKRFALRMFETERIVKNGSRWFGQPCDLLVTTMTRERWNSPEVPNGRRSF